MTYKFELHNGGDSYTQLTGDGANEIEAAISACRRYREHFFWSEKFPGSGYKGAITRIIAAKVAPGILGGKGGIEVLADVSATYASDDSIGKHGLQIWLTRGELIG